MSAGSFGSRNSNRGDRNDWLNRTAEGGRGYGYGRAPGSHLDAPWKQDFVGAPPAGRRAVNIPPRSSPFSAHPSSQRRGSAVSGDSYRRQDSLPPPSGSYKSRYTPGRPAKQEESRSPPTRQHAPAPSKSSAALNSTSWRRASIGSDDSKDQQTAASAATTWRKTSLSTTHTPSPKLNPANIPLPPSDDELEPLPPPEPTPSISHEPTPTPPLAPARASLGIQEALANAAIKRQEVKTEEDAVWRQKMALNFEFDPIKDRCSRDVQLKLESQIYGLYKSKRPSNDGQQERVQLIFEIERAINDHYRQPGAPKIRISPFGSTAYRLSHANSDLDLCVLDPARINGYKNDVELHAALRDPLYDIHRMASILRKLKMSEVQAIPDAVVPIVKFRSPKGIQIDLNINEQLGVRNSRLIDCYCELDNRVRPFFIFLKHWVKQRGLNDSSGQQGRKTLSTYTVLLMGISYLQTIKVLPNLQDPALATMANIPRQIYWARTRDRQTKREAKKGIETPWRSTPLDTTFVEVLPPGAKWRPRKSVHLYDLIEGFFDYYSHFDMEEKIVSVLHGGVMTRQGCYKPRPPRGEDSDVEEFDDEAEEELDTHSSDKQSGLGEKISSLTTKSIIHVEEANPANIPLPPSTSLDPNITLRPSQIPLPPSPTIPPLSLDEIEEPELYTLIDLSEDKPPTPAGEKIEYPAEEFVEPEHWVQKLIVQDPFLTKRNTALNVHEWAISRLTNELERGYRLVVTGKPLAEICADYSRGKEDRRERVRAMRS